MKTLFLTGYDKAFAELGDITSRPMFRYSRRHGFDFFRMTSGAKGEHPSWWKITKIAKEGFKNYERIIWMDADMVITNPSIVPPGIEGYHCSRDWGKDSLEPWKLNNCCWASFPDSLPLFKWLIDNRENWSQEFHEQNHMRAAARMADMIQKGMDDFKITVHPPRVFNAVPIEIHESAVEPWQPGDWAAHLTMVDIDERVRLAKEFIKMTAW